MYARYLLALLISYCLYCAPAYATCQAPQYLSVYNITYQSATLSWSYYGSGSPAYQVQWRVAGSGNWNTGSIVGGTTLTGLTNATLYEWRVRSICAAGDTSDYANGPAFQTKCDPPAYLNVSDVTHKSAQLNWGQPISGATYEVQWRAAGSVTWTVVDGLTTNVLKLTELPDETAFEWNVRTICSGTATSDFVAGPFFQTRCLPPYNTRITLTNPDAVELKWDSPVANGLFDLQWRPAGTSVWTLIEGISTNEYILTGLTNATTYVWQVRTACSATSKSAFSDVQLFHTVCPSSGNQITSSTTYNSAVLQWTAFASDLQWRAAGAADWITVPGAKSPYSLTGLANNTVYEWRVRTVCSPTITSVYTPSQLFTTRCQAPAYPYAYSSGARLLQLSWDFSESSSFEVQWRVAGTTSWSVATGISSPPYNLTGLLPETTYEWRVRTLCSATDYSDFTRTQTVVTACRAPWYIQTGNATNTKIDLSWEPTEAGVRYELQWRVANTINWTTLSDIATASYTLTGLQSNMSYECRVRKLCSATIASDFSPIQMFTLSCVQPTSFYTSTIDISSATLNWYGFTVYPSYEVQYRMAGTSDWTSVAGLTNSFYSLSGLNTNTTYEWRVRSDCALDGSIDFSAVQTFQTQCGPLPSYLSVSGTDFNSAKVSWQTNSNTKLYEIQYRESGNAAWIILRPEGTETDPHFGEAYYADKQYTLYNLIPGKTYEWRIRTICTPSIYSDFVNGPTFTTVCNIPQGLFGYQQTNTSLTISWYTAALLTSYDLQWRSVGSQTWTTINGITNNTYNLTNITSGNTYEYRIRRVCSPGIVSDFSAPITTLIQCITPYPAITRVLSATSAQLEWGYNSTSGINTDTLSHDIQYRLTGTQTWTLLTGIIGITYSLTGLTSGLSYDWRVRAACSLGVPSDFSPVYTFLLTCSTPYVNTYNTQISSTSARLSWGSSSGYTRSYSFQWRVAGAINWSTVSVPYSNYTTIYSLTGLTTNTMYEWRVATNCGDSYLSEFSGIQSFQTACPSVQYLSVNRVGSMSAEVSWTGTDPSSDITYTLQYRISGTVIWSELTSITTTSTSITGLLRNTTYEWRVRAECEAGITSIFSPTSTFLTQCPGPANSFAYDATDAKRQSVIISWSNNADNAFVNLQWRPAYSNTAWNTVTGLTGSAYALTGLSPNTYYQYQLQGVCSTDNPGTYSTWSGSYFYTPSTDLYVYVDSISAQSARLNWTNGPNRTDYMLQWRIRNGSWNTTGLLSAKRYLLTDLAPNTTYDVRVSYPGENGMTYAATTAFTTACPRPTNPATKDIMATSAQLTWTSIGLPISVQWHVAGSTTWNSVTGVTGSSYSLTGLTNNTTYEWRILTQCTANVTNATYPVAFRTVCRMPIWTATENVTPGSAQLRWSDSGAEYGVQYRVAGSTDWTVLTGLASTTYILTGLTNNTTYEWAVATVCDLNTMAYTSPLQFKTQCISARYFAINATAAPDWAQLYWEGSGPTYQFQWRAIGDLTWNDIPAVTSPYTLTGLTPGTTYEYRVRAACAADGPFVAGPMFTTQCNPYAFETKSTNNITARTAQLVWTDNGLSTYGLRWRGIGSSIWTNIPGKATSPYTLTGLSNNTLYEWQLRTPCQPDYSSSQFFQTRCNSPSSLRTEDLTTTSVRLRWNDPGDGLGYEIQWRLAGTSAWNSIPGVMNTSYLLTGLTNFTNYEWQVRSQCGNEALFQLTASFKTANECPLGIYTVRAGSWDDPAVWSCSRVPTPTDQVQLNHTLIIPNGYMAKAFMIRYEAGARLTLGLGATVLLGN